MKTEQYIKIVKQSKNKTLDDFFTWLTQYPEFMELHEIEIQINFMMYSMVNDAYKLGKGENHVNPSDVTNV